MKLKQILMALVALLFVCFATVSEAQTLSKSEKKILKKELKTYKKNPEDYSSMKEKTKTQLQELNDEIESLKAKLAASNKETQNLSDRYASLEMQYAKLKKSCVTSELPVGTVYQVQMGYYEYLDLMSFNSKLKSVKAEEIDGGKRYIIGYFDDVMEAVQFSNDIKNLGIKDAFVTEYTNGKRNMSFDALKSISK